MTIFEIIVIVAIIAIVMLLTAIGTFVKGVWENQKSQEKKLDLIANQIANLWYVQGKIETNTAITSSIIGKMYDNLCCVGKGETQCKDDGMLKLQKLNNKNSETK